ncbi:antibiotic biosynthesis monooxygenase family protein [Marinomonas balearica]|uniref:Antibiotic biosynthesis monooxygenase n=1 Tax=Marinomonas balearica TaxID=491947 RepID=A0A4R6M8T4_9GAMM|nr:antibiotic biosynthesis monooxygenase family protein [Marinomonas balearica]TDO97898.1 antibiotic biosynthesis monooxygenase [Marinomonas balearica]
MPKVIRVFRVEIVPEIRTEFEEKFRRISVGALDSQPGCLDITIGFPSPTTPNEYSMISTWESHEKLVEFLGDKWDQALIPDGMEHFAKHYSAYHYTVA